MSAAQRPRCFLSFLQVFAVGILFLQHVLLAAPQPIQYTLRMWQTDDGLPYYVQAIAQTTHGDLWVGTINGLARFDGVRFTVFDPGNLPQMRNARVNALLGGSDGSLWIGGGIGTLVQMKSGVFISHSEAAQLGDSPVLAFCETRDGSIWIGTREGALQFKDGKFKKFAGEEAWMKSTVRQICEDRQGNLLLATTAGLACLRDGVLVTNYTMASGLPSSVLRAVCEDREGNIWVGSMAGLSQMKDGVFKNFSVSDGLTDTTVSALCVDQRNQLWIGTFNGLNRLAHGQFLTELSMDQLSFDAVYAFFEDREGNFWVGNRDGLYRLNPKRFFTYTQKHGLSRNNVISVLESRAGDMWIGTWGGGANRMRDGKVTAYIAQKPVLGDLVLSLCEDHEGNLWFGTDYQGGLFKYGDGRFTHYGPKDGLANDAVRVIFEDRQTNLWVGTSRALNRFDGRRFARFTTENGLAANTIRAIGQDHEDTIWIGTSGGLSFYRNESFHSLPTLANEMVYAIYADAEQTMWFGTRRKGLNRLRDGKWTAYTKREGLFSDEIFEILEDDHGWLWMSCLNGIFRVSKKELDEFDRGAIKSLACVSYGRSDGMDSAMCVSTAKPAGWKSRDGRLWFPTTKGIVVTDPKEGGKANDQPPPIVIEEVFADKQKVKRDDWRLAEAVGRRDPSITLPPGRGELEFEFSALSYRAPEKNRFKYKLEGVDSEWIDAGTRRSARYNNILPGHYRFRVIGCNNDGVWNELGANVNLTLLPHFWETWWFKWSLGFGGALILAGVYGVREVQRRQIERLRLRLAADLHDEVGSNLGSISLLSRMMVGSENLNDDQKSDLSLINRVSKETANAIKDIVWFTNPQFDTLHDLVKRMEDVAKTLLSGMECRFEGHVENPEHKLSLVFRQNVFLIFKETLANIIKHSHAGAVQIEVEQKGGHWKMRISDNGSGFQPREIIEGNGLVNLRRRAARMQGELKIETEPGRGTRIHFSAPLKERQIFWSKK